MTFTQASLRILIVALAGLVPTYAQGTESKAPAAAADADAKKSDDKAAAADASKSDASGGSDASANAVQPNISGSVEFGYRFIPSLNGNRDAYRSVVNLGEGPKLISLDLNLVDPSHKWFDTADIHASAWGGDPYNTASVNVFKRRLYRFSADYRNIAFYDFLPSFADPQLARGILLNENSRDFHLRSSDLELTLLPDRMFSPYVAYSRSSDYGNGITTFAGDRNEYPVAMAQGEYTNTFRGGLQIALKRWHFNLEEGGTTFGFDEGATNLTPNTGNLTTTFLGQQLVLNSLDQNYRVRGDSAFSRATFAGNPFEWLSVTGQFFYAQPTTSTNYSAAYAGNLYLISVAQFIATGQDVLTANAKMPHPNGDVTLEIRPFKRLRWVNYWYTDRLHNASSAVLDQTVSPNAATIVTVLGSDMNLLTQNYNQYETRAYVDVTGRLTLNGGYRYVWGDATTRAPSISLGPYEAANLERHAGLGGFAFRAAQRLRFSADFEGGSSPSTFFRTSLNDYLRVRARASYDITGSLRLQGSFSDLENSNPDPAIKLDFTARTESLSLFWAPHSGHLFTTTLDYTRSSIRSSVLFIDPTFRDQDISHYVENGHTGTALVGVKWFSFGGSFFISSGSRPTEYYQPMARVSVPLHEHISANAEWRWYGFTERYYAYENFRSNQLMISLRLTR